jgi:hypothetical protein
LDSQPKNIQPNESPETTLDRTRQLIARSRLTLDAADRRLNPHENEEQPTSRERRDS